MRVHSARKRAGVSSIRPVDADAPNVLWAIDFQFDSTVDAKAIKIASVIDEHTRCSLLHLVERSITAERLVVELESVFATAGGPPKVLRMDTVRNWFPKRCNGSAKEGSDSPTPHRITMEQRLHRIVQQPASEGVPQPKPLEHPVRGPRRDRRLQTRTQPPTSLGPGLLNAGQSTLRPAGTPIPRSPARSTESRKQPDSKTGWTQQWGLASNAVRSASPKRDGEGRRAWS